jgi:hypothetical protein
VLESGIVLADLPGLKDVNLARIRAAQEYLIRCDHVLIVENISRAISSESLKSSLFLVLPRQTLPHRAPTDRQQSDATKVKIAVVCTHSEVLFPSLLVLFFWHFFLIHVSTLTRS